MPKRASVAPEDIDMTLDQASKCTRRLRPAVAHRRAPKRELPGACEGPVWTASHRMKRRPYGHVPKVPLHSGRPSLSARLRLS